MPHHTDNLAGAVVRLLEDVAKAADHVRAARTTLSQLELSETPASPRGNVMLRRILERRLEEALALLDRRDAEQLRQQYDAGVQLGLADVAQRQADGVDERAPWHDEIEGTEP